MIVRLRRPSEDELRRLVAEQAAHRPAYPGVGSTLDDDRPAPTGYRSDRYRVEIGDFDAAVEALHHWQVHRGAGLRLAADGPVATGTTVVLAAPLPVGHALAACRIVAIVDEPGERFGFAYGTLPLHPEEGEEAFLIERDRDGGAVFEIRVFWRPHHLLARLGAPVATRLQRQATRRYLDAMVRRAGTPRT